MLEKHFISIKNVNVYILACDMELGTLSNLRMSVTQVAGVMLCSFLPNNEVLKTKT